jgi:polysaccharide export outer membrane protein
MLNSLRSSTMYLRRLVPCRRVVPALILSLATALAGCADGAGMGPGLSERRLGVASLKSYSVGIGDKVKVTVVGEGDLSGTFEINPDGNIALPLVGEVHVAGLDVEGLRSAVVRKLSNGYLRSPRVTVEVAVYRPIYVHGEVRTGGAFPFKAGTRFRDVIAVAGGYNYRANNDYVVLSREGLGREVRVAMPSDILVMPGDNIRVPERFF